jgi:hypothetical protein
MSNGILSAQHIYFLKLLNLLSSRELLERLVRLSLYQGDYHEGSVRHIYSKEVSLPEYSRRS